MSERVFRWKIPCFFNSFRSFFFFRTTNEINIWRDELLKSFDITVWITLIVFTIIISILIKVSLELHRKSLKHNATDSSTLLITFGAFCQQSNFFWYNKRIHSYNHFHLQFNLSDRCRFHTIFLFWSLSFYHPIPIQYTGL